MTITQADRALLSAAEQHDGTPPFSDQTLLAANAGSRKRYAAEHALGVIGDGEIDLVVHPDYRSSGHGTALLTQMLQDHDGANRSIPLLAWAHGENPAAAALLGHAQFVPVRSLLRLALDPIALDTSLSHTRELPAGIELRAYRGNSPDDATQWQRVNARAFADHPEQGAVSIDDFTALTHEPWFDADDLLLAFSGNQLAGYGWIKTTTADSNDLHTELYVLGVDPEFAGIGLGAALMGAVLRRMRAHDPDRISLYVDGDNTNAITIYERAGFTVEQRSAQWRRELKE